MTPNDRCAGRRRAALTLPTLCLSGCATGAADFGNVGACPPVVQYSRECLMQATEQLDLLPEGCAIVDMISGYAVMR